MGNPNICIERTKVEVRVDDGAGLEPICLAFPFYSTHLKTSS